MKFNLVIVTARRLEYAMQKLWEKVKALIQESVQPEHKEVIECYEYIPDQTQLENESPGSLFSWWDQDVLFECLEDGEYQTIEPDPTAIYVQKSPDDSIKLLVWRNGSWIYASEVNSDDTNNLIISDLSELDNIKTEGIYNVTLVENLRIGLTKSTTYTLYVTESELMKIKVFSQTLVSKDGYKQRVYSVRGWGDWLENQYSFEGHTHTIADTSGLEDRLKKIEKLAAAGL